MRIPINWLKEYVDTKSTAEKISEELLLSGTENEILSNVKIDEKVVVGEIIKIEPHPNADKLRLPTVKISSTKTIKLVCGAKNIEVGQKVPVALVGAKLGDFEISEAEIRGVKSVGMICSAQELGIEEHSEGIMILNPKSKIGESVGNLLSKESSILEAELTPNRGDCLSIIGIARELAVIEGLKLNLPEIKLKESTEKIGNILVVEIKDKDLCQRYMARVVGGIKNNQSPNWLKEKLESYGIRPISAVVDITNYVMVEFGQPLHAFDLTRIGTNNGTKKYEIVIRSAKDGEEIVTLDNAKRKLTKEDLIIADPKQPIAIAGVMGGANTQVDESTTEIVLESATFNKTSVRKTAQRLALRSESSNRFEKGIPLKLNEIALDRAVQLIIEICGGELVAGKVDERSVKEQEVKIYLDILEVEKVLGEKIKENEIKTILENLGFKITKKKDSNFEVIVPWWRLDISIKEDLFEEIARIYGYNKIKGSLPKGEVPEIVTSPILEFEKEIKRALTSRGFCEAFNYSFVSEASFKKLGIDLAQAVKISNPISVDAEFMRTSLVPSLLENVARNQNNFENIKIFELARTYLKNNSKNSLPLEEKHVCGALVGVTKDSPKNGNEFYQVKGILTNIFRKFDKVSLERSKESFLNLARSADIFVNDKKVGFLGEISQNTQKNFGINKTTVVFNINVEKLFAQGKKELEYSPFSRFPSVSRDLAFLVDKKTQVKQILAEISKIESPLIREAKIADIYEGKELGEGKKSIALGFVYQSFEKTLEENEVSEIENKIIKNITQKLGGVLRDNN